MGDLRKINLIGKKFINCLDYINLFFLCYNIIFEFKIVK